MNYNNLPSVKCNDRISLGNVPEQYKKNMCEGLNPNLVLHTLYPGYTNPLINYAEYSKKIPDNFDLFSNNKYEMSNSLKCARKCMESKCSNFVHMKPSNFCVQHKTKSNQKEDDSNNFVKTLKKIFNIKTFDKAPKRCQDPNNIQKNFYKKDGYYIYNEYQNTQKTPSKYECLQKCYSNKDCNSVTYLQGNDVCYTSEESNVPNLSYNHFYDYYPTNTYIKNPTLKINNDFFVVPEEYIDNYKNYPDTGLPGDNFCKYNPANNTCSTTFTVPGRKIPKFPSRNQIDSQRNQAYTQRNQLDSQRNQIDTQRNQLDSQRNQAYNQRNQLDTQRNQIDSQRNQLDSQRNQAYNQYNQ